jgi:hypothetical protein
MVSSLKITALRDLELSQYGFPQNPVGIQRFADVCKRLHAPQQPPCPIFSNSESGWSAFGQRISLVA